MAELEKAFRNLDYITRLQPSPIDSQTANQYSRLLRNHTNACRYFNSQQTVPERIELIRSYVNELSRIKRRNTIIATVILLGLIYYVLKPAGWLVCNALFVLYRISDEEEKTFEFMNDILLISVPLLTYYFDLVFTDLRDRDLFIYTLFPVMNFRRIVLRLLQCLNTEQLHTNFLEFQLAKWNSIKAKWQQFRKKWTNEQTNEPAHNE